MLSIFFAKFKAPINRIINDTKITFNRRVNVHLSSTVSFRFLLILKIWNSNFYHLFEPLHFLQFFSISALFITLEFLLVFPCILLDSFKSSKFWMSEAWESLKARFFLGLISPLKYPMTPLCCICPDLSFLLPGCKTWDKIK